MPRQANSAPLNTPQRDAVLRREYAAGTDIAVIINWVNSLEGEKMTERQIMYRIRRLRIFRSQEFKRTVARECKLEHYKKNPKPRRGPEEKKQTRACWMPKDMPPAVAEKRLMPLRRLKDGGPSLAFREMREAESAGRVAFADAETISEWGWRWAASASLDAINAKRLEYGLPVFVRGR